ncbi:PadR family transcriptional regulator [Streptomyces sp. NPDC023998]|uniref:PadR family transcriptional regulator n=1 Tax=Streptomyces sp. NPDC023998 TaxID=3154597 RepID=UPI0033FA073B
MKINGKPLIYVPAIAPTVLSSMTSIPPTRPKRAVYLTDVLYGPIAIPRKDRSPKGLQIMITGPDNRRHLPVITRHVATVLSSFLTDPTEPRYGLELMRDTGLSSGTLYPLLIRLERAGWLASAPEDVDPHKEGRPRRRIFTITPEGIRAARTSLADLAKLETESRAQSDDGAKARRRLKPA